MRNNSFSSPLGTEMFHFPRFPSSFKTRTIIFCIIRFPHSEIPGSKVACHLPEAYRRLLRPSSAFDVEVSTICSIFSNPLLNPYLLSSKYIMSNIIVLFRCFLSYLNCKWALENKKPLSSGLSGLKKKCQKLTTGFKN